MQNYQDFLAEILIDEETLKKRTAELGAQISADYIRMETSFYHM